MSDRGSSKLHVTYPAKEHDRRAGLPPPKFRLSTLFWIITSVSCLLLAMKALGPIGASVLALFMLAIAAHVLGNVLGTRLRQQGDVAVDEDGRAVLGGSLKQVRLPEPHEFAPATNLSKHHPLGRSNSASAGVGALLGAVASCSALTYFGWEHATFVNVAFGTVASAILGGLFAFWLSSFLRVFWDALHDAQR